METLQERFTRRVRVYAQRQGLTVTHLPDYAAVSRAHFWDVMAGRKSPTLAWVSKVAEALGCDPGDLLARRGP